MENVFPFGARPHRFPFETKDEYDVLEGGLGEFLPNYTVYQCLTARVNDFETGTHGI